MTASDLAFRLAAPFAPMRLLGQVPADGQVVVLPGVVLLADLADFTGLAEALAAQGGVDSGELVSRGLNQVLAPAVDAVMQQGGEIVKFSGDGLLCLFVGGPDALQAAQHAAHRIVAAGVAGPTGKAHHFRCVVVQGPVALACIGGHAGRFELVAGGAAVDLAQQLVPSAVPGVVGDVVTLNAAAIPTPTPTPPVPPTSTTALPAAALDPASLLPAFVRERLSDNLAQWLQEFRTLTMVFAATDLAPDLAALQTIAHDVQLVVDGQAGQLLSFGLEGQRLVAQIAFGLVVGAAATRPREAMQCAVQLAQAVPGTRVGIATGRVLLGPIGSAERRQLTTMGGGVILAARLMQQAAPGEVLADDTSWAASAGGFEASPGRAHLKGLGERNFWRVQAAGKRPSTVQGTPEAAILGRADAVAAVRAALALADTPARPILIRGEAGIGKSRFSHWLFDELQAGGVASWAVAASPIGRDTPYAALAPVLADLCGLRPGAPAASHQAQLAQLAQSLLGDAGLAPLLGDALRLSIPDTARTAAMAGAVRADNIRQALCALFSARAALGASALLVDDAHWLDPSSWALLQRLVVDVAALRVVIVARPMPGQEPRALQAIQAQQALVLKLQTLNAADITALAARRLASQSLPPAVAQWLTERARGNPLFAQELAAMLLALGVVDIRDGAFLRVPAPADLAAIPLTATIESILEQRIECIGVEDAVALKVASVLGLSFSLDALGQLLPLAAHAPGIAAVVKRLIAADLAVAVGPGQFAFRHRYTQEAAYRMLPGERRRVLHRQVAAGLEHSLGARAAQRAGELAHHWFAAQDPPRAMHWLDLAGLQALRSGADGEAAAHFRRALSIGDGQPAGRLASWRRQLAQALFGLGQVEEVAVEARRAFELVARPLPASALGWLGLTLRTALRRTLTLPGWPGAGAKPPRHDQADLIEGARAAGLLAESAYFVNAPEMMLGSALLAVDLSERAACAAPVSVAYGMLGVVAGMARLHRTARRYLARARQLAEQAADPMQQGVAWFYTGMYHGCLGDWAASLDAEQRALACTEPLHAHAQSGFQLTLLATNALYTSEYDKTRAWMATVGQRAERSANRQQQGWACNVLSVADLHQAQYTQAFARAEQARQIFLVERDRISLIIADGVQCAALCRNSQMAQALACADRASAVIAGAKPTTWGQLEGFAGPCEVYASASAQGLLTAQQARRRAAAAMTGLRLFALVFPFGRARYHWICSLFDIGHSKPRAARRRVRRAIVLARRFGMPVEALCAAQLLAGLVPAPEQRALQARAQTLAAALQPGWPALALPGQRGVQR